MSPPTAPAPVPQPAAQPGVDPSATLSASPSATPSGSPSPPAHAQAALSWSAGKDACLALLRARDQGLAVRSFITMCEPLQPDGQGGASLSHRLPRSWLAAQAAAFGVDWWPVSVPRTDAQAYTRAFDAALRALRDSGHTHLVFGDIDLVAHRDWLVPRCEAAGLQPVFPLWCERREALAREVLARGIRARLVAVDTQRLDAHWCGQPYDAALLAALPEGVCPCGEEGEFHTAVEQAPGMSAPVPLPPHRVVLRPSRPPLRPTVLAELVFGPEADALPPLPPPPPMPPELV